MSDLMIKCPHCKKEFPFTATIAAQDIREEVRGEFEEKERAKEKEFERKELALQAEAERIKNEKKELEEQVRQRTEEAKKKIEQEASRKVREEMNVTMQDLKNQLEEKAKNLDEAQEKEVELLKMQRQKDQEILRKERAVKAQAEQLQNERKDLEDQVSRQTEAARKKIEEDASRKAREEMNVTMRDLKNQLAENAKNLDAAHERELELLKAKRDMEQKGKELELAMEHKLAAARQSIEAKARARFADEHELKLQDKEKTIRDLVKQLDEMKRRAEQGPQPEQGEVLELELEDTLKTQFPQDRIEPVPKGVKGADVLQKVYDDAGQQCGTIIWESKRTKAWSDGWVAKLKEDKRAAKADIAALLSVAFPKDFSNLGQINGVWVANRASLVGLATALRATLVQVAGEKTALVGKQSKKELLYTYISGAEFRQHLEAIVDYSVNMHGDLAKERANMERIWARRQKQIDQVLKNTAAFCGDFQGIMGGFLPQLKTLEVKQLGPGKGSDEDRHSERQEEEPLPSQGTAASQGKADEQGEKLDPPQRFVAGGLVFQYDDDYEGVWHDSKGRGVCLMNSKDQGAKSVAPNRWKGCYLELDDFFKDGYLFRRIVSDLKAIPYFSAANAVRSPARLGDE